MFAGSIELPADKGGVPATKATGTVFPKFCVIGPISLKTELKQYSQPSPAPPP